MKRNGQGQIKTCRRKQHVKTDGMKGIPNLFCGIFAVGGNYNLTRDIWKETEVIWRLNYQIAMVYLSRENVQNCRNR